MQASCATGNAVTFIRVSKEIKLFVVLYKCIYHFYRVLKMYVVIGCTVNEKEFPL